MDSSRYVRRVGKEDLLIIGIIALISFAVYVLDDRRLNLLGGIGLTVFVGSITCRHFFSSGDERKFDLFSALSRVGLRTASASIFFKGLSIAIRQEAYAHLSDKGLLQGGNAIVQGIFLICLSIGVLFYSLKQD